MFIAAAKQFVVCTSSVSPGYSSQIVEKAYISGVFNITAKPQRILDAIRVSKLCTRSLLTMIRMAEAQSQLRQGLNAGLACPE